MSGRRDAGYSVIELLTVISVVGIFLGSNLVHYDPRREDINTALQSALSDVRAARSAAITSGKHVAVQLYAPSAWSILRMDDGGGTWTPVAELKAVALPTGVTVSTTATNPMVEFNTRGLVVNHDTTVQVTLNDQFGAARQVTIWPSGEVQPE